MYVNLRDRQILVVVTWLSGFPVYWFIGLLVYQITKYKIYSEEILKWYSFVSADLFSALYSHDGTSSLSVNMQKYFHDMLHWYKISEWVTIIKGYLQFLSLLTLHIIWKLVGKLYSATVKNIIKHIDIPEEYSWPYIIS